MLPNINLNVPRLPTPKITKVTIPKVSFQVPDFWEGQERQPIPKTTRMEVWKRRFGDRKSGKCYCCKERMVYIDAFLCGHCRAHAGRGSNNPENLEPICLRCNSKMGTFDLEPWCNKHFPKRMKGKRKTTKNAIKNKPKKAGTMKKHPTKARTSRKRS
jgi:hypothetical protein